MHTVDLLDQAILAAEGLGYRIRQEYLGETGGGVCEIGGRKWLFLDVAMNAAEQLGQIVDALRNDPGIYSLKLPRELQDAIGLRRVA